MGSEVDEELFQKMIAMGREDYLLDLGTCYEHGYCDKTKDPSRAFAYYWEAYARGSERAFRFITELITKNPHVGILFMLKEFKELKEMKTRLHTLEKKMSDLQVDIEYYPGGEKYEEARNDFKKLMEGKISPDE